MSCSPYLLSLHLDINPSRSSLSNLARSQLINFEYSWNLVLVNRFSVYKNISMSISACDFML